MKTLKRLIFGDKVTLPPKVKQRMKEYKRKGEFYIHFFCKIEYKGHYYYNASYGKWNFLIVREDGEVPPLSEIESVLWMANTTDAMAMTITTLGKRWAKDTTRYHERMLTLLNRIDHQMRNTMPQEIREALDAFFEVSRTFIQSQEVIKENYQKGKAFLDYITKTYILTEEKYHELSKYKHEMWKAAYLSTKLQMDTYEKREKLIQYLVSNVSISSFRLWLTVRELKYHHKKLADPKKRIAWEIEALEPYHDELIHKAGEKGYRTQIDVQDFEEKVLPNARNPK
ncbi:hypothetical protein C8P63_1526 [Melghirimyces profundicolus]|uniref:Uncharacterized protein n=1 Tax=Melghirimyces profundicolus TaxID=1242148 RepID=A0A2T6AU89_9BACL|nr:hypothetical protein [Melghirimyces profundicolus]PTX47375.1 hypothetical protein C8P63_1526 [Melghirimyces profundicolus]